MNEQVYKARLDRQRYIAASAIQTEMIVENSCAIFAGFTMYVFFIIIHLFIIIVILLFYLFGILFLVLICFILGISSSQTELYSHSLTPLEICPSRLYLLYLLSKLLLHVCFVIFLFLLDELLT